LLDGGLVIEERCDDIAVVGAVLAADRDDVAVAVAASTMLSPHTVRANRSPSPTS